MLSIGRVVQFGFAAMAQLLRVSFVIDLGRQNVIDLACPIFNSEAHRSGFLLGRQCEVGNIQLQAFAFVAVFFLIDPHFG